MVVRKQYARRSLIGYEFTYVDPFSYKPIVMLGRDETIEILARSTAGTLSADIDLDTGREFDALIEFAHTAFAPEHWLVAYLEGQLVGIVFPQRYWDKMEEGSIFCIGVVPEARGRGYGRILHARGLQELAAQGVTEYVGSTDVHNTPMIAIFLANGCRLTAIREIEMEDHANQRILK